MEHIEDMRQPLTKSNINDLRHRVTRSQILEPGEDGFHQKLERWSQAAVKPAAAILVADGLEDISTAVSFCNDHDIDLAICGGGHSTSGASSSAAGLVVDLGLLRKVSVDPKEKTVHAEGGCTWADIDDTAASHGLACVGGTVRHTGVGGLVLGGGYGWLSGLHGLAIDNLLAAKVVIADGTILQVSPVENANLFWALRGAGHNFGVVVEFVFQAHDHESFWGGLLAFRPSALRPVIEFWNQLVDAGAGQATGGVGFVRLPPQFEPALIVPALHFGPMSVATSAFRPLLQLDPIFQTLDVHRWPAANDLLMAPYGFRTTMKGGFFRLPLRAEFVEDLFLEFCEFTTRCPDARGSIVVFEMLNAKKVCEVEADATAFSSRIVHCNAQIIPFWKNKDNDLVCREWAREVSRRIEEEWDVQHHPGGSALVQRSAYGNYSHSADGAKKMFGPNYERLQKIKREFDPRNTFNKLFAIVP